MLARDESVLAVGRATAIDLRDELRLLDRAAGCGVGLLLLASGLCCGSTAVEVLREDFLEEAGEVEAATGTGADDSFAFFLAAPRLPLAGVAGLLFLAVDDLRLLD